MSPRDNDRSICMTAMILFSSWSIHAPPSTGSVAIRIGLRTFAVKISGGDSGETYEIGEVSLIATAAGDDDDD